jgi:hypothetical protein
VILAVGLEIGMNMRKDHWVDVPVRDAGSGVARVDAVLERDRVRWDEIQKLFELCRDRSRDEWYAVLRAECPGRESIAFEVMTLLVAAENLPPIDDGTERAR